jgi:spermidine synthase
VAAWLQPGTADLEGVRSVLIWGSLAASLLLFAPSMMVLGAVSPVAVRLLAGAGAGRAAGRVFAISTLGSLAGTYAATHWIVPERGSRVTILIAAGMLLVPGVIGLLTRGGRAAVVALVTLVLGGTAAAFAQAAPGRGVPDLGTIEEGGRATLLAEVETPYQYVTVRDDAYRSQTYRLLTINEGVYTYHSFEIANQVLTNSRYYDDYAAMPALLDLPDGAELRGCVVGLACGVTPRQWRHFWGARYDLKVDGAEIDPVVIDLGRKHFHLPPADDPRLRAYAMDGRQLLATVPADRRYHMIAIDAFANELYIPFHLATREFFRLCRDRLEPGGVLAMNVYASRADSPNLAAIENTLADAFGSCIRVRQTWATGNYLLLARRGDAPPDMTRLTPPRLEDRFGKPADVSEWDGLVKLSARLPWASTLVRPDPAKFLLTDDHAPLEHMTDRFLDRDEREKVR